MKNATVLQSLSEVCHDLFKWDQLLYLICQVIKEVNTQHFNLQTRDKQLKYNSGNLVAL